MRTFVVDPLVGVGPVHLGANRDAVLAALGAAQESFSKVPTSQHQTDAWFENGFQVFYEGEHPTVAFIELSISSNYEVILFGISVFDNKATVLVSELKHHATLDETDPELGYTYTFPSLELGFWRPDDDEERAPYFSTVGIGVPGYYSASE